MYNWKKTKRTLLNLMPYTAVVAATISSNAIAQSTWVDGTISDSRYAGVTQEMIDVIESTGATSGKLHIREYLKEDSDYTDAVNQSYGWLDDSQDINKRTPVDVLMRTASLAKPLTAALVRDRVDDGVFNWTTKVFCEPLITTNCLISGRNFINPHYYSITIDDLLTHKAFNDGMDLPPSPQALAQSLQKTPTIHDFLDVLEQDTQLSNGISVGNYSNFGYNLLAHIVEHQFSNYKYSYRNHIRGLFYNTIPYWNIQLAAPSLERRMSISPNSASYTYDREPEYYDQGSGCKKSYPSFNDYVACADGGHGLYGDLPGAGGISITTSAYMTFMENYWIGPHSETRENGLVVNPNGTKYWSGTKAFGGSGWGTRTLYIQNIYVDPSDMRADLMIMFNHYISDQKMNELKEGILQIVKDRIVEG